MYKILQELIFTENYDIFLDIFPSLKDLQTTPQDLYYHAEGGVRTHTKMVLNSLLTKNLIKPFSQYSAEKHLSFNM